MDPVLHYARPTQRPKPVTPAPALIAILGAPLLIIVTHIPFVSFPDSAILIYSIS